jgi:hypothetical protein
MGRTVDQHRLLDWRIAKQTSMKNELEEVVSSPDLETDFHRY